MRKVHPTRMSVRATRAGRRRASTLIELLVVISVIGFLTALLLPSLRRSTEMAAATVCRHHLRELGHSLQMYRIEHDGWLPVVEKPRATSNSSPREERGAEAWFGKLYPTYLPDPGVLRCPRDPYGFRLATASASNIRDPDVADFASYGLNNFILTFGDGVLANVDRNGPRRPLDNILAADLGPDQPRGERRGASAGPIRNDSLLNWSDGFDPFSPSESSTWVTMRHGEGIHMLTLAGGVRDVRTVDVLRNPMRRSYRACAAGGCTLCNELKLFHYNFAKEQLFWWTGPIPSE